MANNDIPPALRFPADWPQGCPPTSATEANGMYHRIVSNDPPVEQDLKSHAELGLAVGAPQCRRVGISVYPTRAHACHRLRMSPHLGTMIAAGELRAHHGKVEVTHAKSGHTEWWPYEGVNRHDLFGGASRCP